VCPGAGQPEYARERYFLVSSLPTVVEVGSRVGSAPYGCVYLVPSVVLLWWEGMLRSSFDLFFVRRGELSGVGGGGGGDFTSGQGPFYSRI
jgi:hypothetical protein